jgi:cysteine-rich repeat protein
VLRLFVVDRLQRTCAATVFLCVACSESEPPPSVVRFEASAVSVARGRPVNLEWEVTGADHVTVVAQPDETLVSRSPDATGSVLTPPVTRTRRFTIEAVRGDLVARDELQVTALDLNREVVIESFTAMPESVAPGSATTLSWRLTSATGGSISTSAGGVVEAEIAVPTGSVEVSPESTTTYVLSALGVGGPVMGEVTVVVERPTIDVFVANPDSIDEGDSATLSWVVRFASNVVIRDDNGAEVIQTTNAADQITVSPLESTEYTLTANGADGLLDRASVQIAVDNAAVAEVRSFTASPSTVNIGEVSTLTWDVTGARNGIEIDVGGNVLLATSNPRGTLEVQPGVTTEYRLTALGQTANDAASTTVTVNPSPPAILSLQASPNPALLNADVRVSWVTLGADTVTLRRGAQTLVNSTKNVETGAVTLSADAATIDLELSATNAEGTVTRPLTITAYPRPTIDSFDVSPLTFNQQANITIDYATTDATRVELRLSGVPDAMFDTQQLSGTHVVAITQSTLFELIASNPASAATASVLVSDTVGKIEPNDTPMTAVGFLAGGGNTSGTIDPVGDVDFYRVDVVDGGNLRADLSSNLSCATDTFLELIAPDGVTVLGSDDDDGVGACSAIVPAEDAFATDLAAGTYYFRVSAGTPGLTGAYDINVVASSPACGNGIREARAMEQCDDGAANGPAGACSSTCQRNVTILSTLTAPTAQTIPGSIASSAEEDVYRIVVASPSFLVARTYAPASPDCEADTRLTLYDENFVPLGENDQTLIDPCSMIHPLFDPFATLAAGTYYLVVEEGTRSNSIASYQLQVEVVAPGCGNGIVEAGETCDDHDTTPGDGCSATCQFEGLIETEPNAPLTNAEALGANVRALGRIDPAGDGDFYSVTVPAGWSLAVDTYDPYGTCRGDLGMVDAEVLLYDASGATLGSDDNSGTGRCARIDPVEDTYAQVLAAGTYYVQVRNNLGTETGDYRVDVQPIMPTCGNGILELAATEQCDDGNTTTQDGCASCQFELTGTTTVSATYALSFASGNAARVVQVDLATAGTIAATTSPCTSVRAELIDSAGATLEVHEPTTTLTCPTFSSQQLAAGTYFVRVTYVPLEETSPATGSASLSLTVN